MAAAPHQRLIVYQRAIAVAVDLDRIAQSLPWIRRDLRDQLLRASASVVLNVAEGADDYSPAEKARFFRMARRSSAECIAILDLIDALGHAATGNSAAQGELLQVNAMLTALVRRQASRQPSA